MKKITAIFLVIVLVAIVIAGCNKTPSIESTQTSSAAVSESTTVGNIASSTGSDYSLPPPHEASHGVIIYNFTSKIYYGGLDTNHLYVSVGLFNSSLNVAGKYETDKINNAALTKAQEMAEEFKKYEDVPYAYYAFNLSHSPYFKDFMSMNGNYVHANRPLAEPYKDALMELGYVFRFSTGERVLWSDIIGSQKGREKEIFSKYLSTAYTNFVKHSCTFEDIEGQLNDELQFIISYSNTSSGNFESDAIPFIEFIFYGTIEADSGYYPNPHWDAFRIQIPLSEFKYFDDVK